MVTILQKAQPEPIFLSDDFKASNMGTDTVILSRPDKNGERREIRRIPGKSTIISCQCPFALDFGREGCSHTADEIKKFFAAKE